MHWQTEKIYYLRQDYFSDLVDSIREAKSLIDLETYIFNCDPIGQLILQELRAAAARKVEVRLIVDGFGSYFEIPKIVSILSGSSVQLKVFHPFLFPQATSYKWLRLDLLLQALSEWNRRLHRKTCLIDTQILFLGSFNITDNSNRETGVRVTGQAALEMLKVFEIIWKRMDKIRLKQSKLSDAFDSASLLRMNYSRKVRKKNNKDLCQRITLAQKRVWITNAYFVPPPKILKALLAAKNKGIDVEILVPACPDLRFMKLIMETYYRGLLIIGIQIFEYQKDFLHAKSLIIDDYAIVGSSNMNYRSFFHDLEIDIVLTHGESLSSLEKQFVVDRSHSVEITMEGLIQRRWLDRIFTWFLSFVRDWL